MSNAPRMADRDVLRKCSICRALLDEEDLFCANCGVEAPQRDPAPSLVHETLTHHFECEGCGASMSYDASAQALQCPFCGSRQLASHPPQRSLAADGVIPFAVDRPRAERSLRQWLGNGFWRPSDLATTARIASITAVYVPYWVFSASTMTYWTADTSETPPGARGDWFPLAGYNQGQHQGVLVGASGVLTPAETAQICPFDLRGVVSPAAVDLERAIVEQFRVGRKYARPLARQGLEMLERQACRAYVPGRARNVKVNVRLDGLQGRPLLVPVWVLAYRYRGQLYRFLINGQTGRTAGTAPFSWLKPLLIAAGIAVGVLLLLALIAVLAAAG